MKTAILLLCLLIGSLTAPAADSTGVHFYDGLWQQVLLEASRSQKPVFIDFYTTWCGPCKRLQQEAFPHPRVAAFYNQHFINYKVDAEKGEGVSLAKKYEIHVYPTLVFIEPSGKEIYRTAGYSDPEWLMEQGQRVVSAQTTLSQLTNAQPATDPFTNQSYLKAYLTQLARLRQPVDSLLERYLDGLSDAELLQEDNLAIMAGCVATTKSRAFTLLLDKWPLLKNTPIGREAYITLPNAVALDFARLVERSDEAGLDPLVKANQQLLTIVGSTVPSPMEEKLLFQRIDFYRQTKRYEKYHQLANFYAQTQLMNLSTDSIRRQDAAVYQYFLKGQRFASDSLRRTPDYIELDKDMRTRYSAQIAEKLDDLALAYYESVSNPAHLKEALAWSQRSLELFPHFWNRKTYAHLLYKLGRRKEAIRQQQAALAKAESMGRDAKELALALTQMRKGSL